MIHHIRLMCETGREQDLWYDTASVKVNYFLQLFVQFNHPESK